MKYFSTTLLLLFSIVGYSQSRILVDGLFDEWEDYPILYTDATGDGGFSGIDFERLQIYNDDDFIFFIIDSGKDINLQDLNEISIYLDTDDDPNTGFSTNGIGAELKYTFGNRSGVFYGAGSSSTIFHADIGLVSAPTVTSDRFEIGIKRNISISGTPVFQGDALKVIFKDDSSNGDILPADNGGIAYSFLSDNLEPLPNYSIQKSQDADIRIMSYNVLFDGLFDQDRIPSFTRIMRATQPDIIGFQEISNYSSAQVAAQMETMLPSATGQQWYHAKQGPDCHAISRYPIVASALIPGYNSSAGNGAFLIELPAGEQMLLIVAHPPCCANNSGRQVEVDLMMEFLREAKNGTGAIPLEADTPIFILGDMNFVGDRRQLETLLTGDILNNTAYGPDFIPDWNGNDLLDSHPNTTGVPFSYSWYNEQSNFSPGRLDYIIYSGSSLSLQNSYNLFTPGLSQDNLVDFNLLTNDAVIASDHLPVVADFKFKNFTTQKEPPAHQNNGMLKVQPNPAYGLTEFIFEIDQPEFALIQLYNQNGKIIKVLQQKNITSGEHKIQLNTTNFPSGVYFVKLKTSKFSAVKKIIILN